MNRRIKNPGKFWDKAWSLVDQCTPVSEGCRNCWLKTLNKRTGKPWDGNVTFRADRLDIPLRTRKPTVYAIWSDLYHPSIWLSQVLAAFKVIQSCPQHTFLIVTKRPEAPAEHRRFLPELPNVYHLITVENQEMADQRIPHALKILGKVGLLIEPMLGPVDLYYWLRDPGHCCPQCGIPIIRGVGNSYDDERKLLGNCVRCNHEFGTWVDRISCVLLGGETGHHARPMHPDWARSVRDQCEEAGVPFFFKSNGEWIPDDFQTVTPRGYTPKRIYIDEYGFTHEVMPPFRDSTCMMRIGSKKAGRLLDGREHNELPWRAE